MIVILGPLPSLANTEEVSGDGSVLFVVPVLVPLVAVTVEDQDRQADIVLRVLLVQTELLVEVSDLSSPEDLVREQVRHLVLQVPVEALTLQRFSQ